MDKAYMTNQPISLLIKHIYYKRVISRVITIIFCIGLVDAQTAINIDKFIERNGMYYLPNKNNPHTGEIFELYPDFKTMKCKGSLKNGKQHGVWKFWWENGNLMAISTYKDGLLNGSDKKWYENGKIWLNTTYKNGLLNGKWIGWYEENGQKWIEMTYKEGKPNKLYYSWHKNGVLGVSGNHINCKRDGKWTWWHDNGKKSYEELYINGEMISSTSSK